MENVDVYKVRHYKIQYDAVCLCGITLLVDIYY
jgi:hypothetical protein